MYSDSRSHMFRLCGVLLGVVFHLAMFALAFTSGNAQAGGYRFLLLWYMPCIVLGLPWSIPAMFADAFVPGLGLIGLAAAVCFNGYLIGWVLDAIVNHSRSAQQRQVLASRRDVLTMDQLRASESASNS